MTLSMSHLIGLLGAVLTCACGRRFSRAGPLGENGRCEMPRKPGSVPRAMPRRLTNAGTSLVLPRTRETTEPNAGQPPGGWLRFERPVRQWKSEWSSTASARERMRANLSVRFASLGRCSQI